MQYFENNLLTRRINKNNTAAIIEMKRYELRADITEWYETLSVSETSSPCIVMTVVQRLGSGEQQILPQEYKSLKAARMDSSRVLADVMADCGARDFTAEIREDRLVVTTDNRYKITMVID